MLSKDYSAEFKQRFADRYADGATITMLQHEFGLTKSTVKLWRERIDQGGVGAIDRLFLIAFIFRKSRDKSFGFHDDCFAS